MGASGVLSLISSGDAEGSATSTHEPRLCKWHFALLIRDNHARVVCTYRGEYLRRIDAINAGPVDQVVRSVRVIGAPTVEDTTINRFIDVRVRAIGQYHRWLSDCPVQRV